MSGSEDLNQHPLQNGTILSLTERERLRPLLAVDIVPQGLVRAERADRTTRHAICDEIDDVDVGTF